MDLHEHQEYVFVADYVNAHEHGKFADLLKCIGDFGVDPDVEAVLHHSADVVEGAAFERKVDVQPCCLLDMRLHAYILASGIMCFSQSPANEHELSAGPSTRPYRSRIARVRAGYVTNLNWQCSPSCRGTPARSIRVCSGVLVC
jgi:hypothetical protein